jgi:hypothetical protein
LAPIPLHVMDLTIQDMNFHWCGLPRHNRPNIYRHCGVMEMINSFLGRLKLVQKGLKIQTRLTICEKSRWDGSTQDGLAQHQGLAPQIHMLASLAAQRTHTSRRPKRDLLDHQIKTSWVAVPLRPNPSAQGQAHNLAPRPPIPQVPRRPYTRGEKAIPVRHC